MDKIYHFYAKGYLDESRVFIKKDEKCLIPTADCFWKDPHGIINTIKTRTQTEKQNIIDRKNMMNCCSRKREMENSI